MDTRDRSVSGHEARRTVYTMQAQSTSARLRISTAQLMITLWRTCLLVDAYPDGSLIYTLVELFRQVSWAIQGV